jgi:hypothetical protein
MVAVAAASGAGYQASREISMPGTLNFKKVAKTIKIFLVAQVGLVAMLVYMAVLFQQKFQALGRPDRFVSAVLWSCVVQLALFYPIFKFSGKEADRDLQLTATNLNNEEVKALTKKKRYSDIAKFSVFCFFTMFILQAPSHPSFLSVLYFSFILTILTYLQCYNFAAKKLIKAGTSARV